MSKRKKPAATQRSRSRQETGSSHDASNPGTDDHAALPSPALPHSDGTTTDSTPPLAYSRWKRIAVSVFVVFHLVAVFGPPLAFQARGPVGGSPSVQTLITPTNAYSQFLYLDRGYAFFAPDPGPSHLLRYTVTDPDGSTHQHMIPDRNDQWPRLLYHRHFMLTEFLQESYAAQPPAGPVTQFVPEEYEQLQIARDRYVAVRDSLHKHLKQQYPNSKVEIAPVAHVLPSFVDVNDAGIKLQDPRLYETLIDDPIPNLAPSPSTNFLLPTGQAPIDQTPAELISPATDATNTDRSTIKTVGAGQ